MTFFDEIQKKSSGFIILNNNSIFFTKDDKIQEETLKEKSIEDVILSLPEGVFSWKSYSLDKNSAIIIIGSNKYTHQEKKLFYEIIRKIGLKIDQKFVSSIGFAPIFENMISNNLISEKDKNKIISNSNEERQIIHRLLATSDAYLIMTALQDGDKITIKEIIKKIGLKDRETEFHIMIRELWEHTLIDKEVDVNHNVKYCINNFGQKLFSENKSIDMFDKKINIKQSSYKNDRINSNAITIRISREIYNLINYRLLKKSLKINDIFYQAIRNYKTRPLTPSEMSNIRFTEDNTGIIMNDPVLGDIIVRSKKQQPFCEYHQLENIQCVHIEKANLVKNFRTVFELDKPKLPQTKPIKLSESVEIEITPDMAYDLEQIRKEKKISDISETLCYVTVNSFNKEIGFRKNV